MRKAGLRLFICYTFCCYTLAVAGDCSVTRFGEILPLGQHFINLGQIVESLFSVWQIFEPTLENVLYSINVARGQILKNKIAIWSQCRPRCNPDLTVFLQFQSLRWFYLQQWFKFYCIRANQILLFVSTSSVTRWLDHSINFWSFTKDENLPQIAYTICQSRLKNCPLPNKSSKKAKYFKILPRLRHFATSGHTVD